MRRDPIAIPLKVLKVRQPIGDFYVASIPAIELVKISSADVRRMEERDVEKYLGIQRELSISRTKEIQSYVRRSDATFPTSIILAVSDKCAEYDEQSSTLTLKEFFAESGSDEKDILLPDIAQILDGQHRIAGFYDLVERRSDLKKLSYARDLNGLEFDLNISIFIGADIAEQGNIFATVNFTQTKVNKSLVYDLMALAEHRSPQKTCHNIAVALDDPKQIHSPFRERIKRLGVATKGRTLEPLTQANFVESLLGLISENPAEDRENLKLGRLPELADRQTLKKYPFRNLFLNKKDLEIYEIVFNFFSAIAQKWPDSWNDLRNRGNILPRSNAFKAFMKYLKTHAYPQLVGKDFERVPTIQEFYSTLSNMNLEDKDFTRRNFVPGGGGQTMFYKVLTGEISAEELFEES